MILAPAAAGPLPALAQADGALGRLLLELGGAIFVLALLARLAHRAGFSPIPLYLLGGLAFGEGGLLPLAVGEQIIEVGAEIGVALLLLLLGLEYTGRELGEGLRTGWPAGLVDLALNFTPGLLIGLALGWDPVAAVLLGGVTYNTSSGIMARMLAEFGRLGNRETPSVLMISVLEDLTNTVYLPLVGILLLGVGWATGLLSMAVALVTVVLVLLAAIRYGPQLSRLIESRSDEVVLLTTFGLLLVLAGVAEQLQISAAIAAFLLGIALSEPVADRARRILGPLRDLFAAMFFLFFGLQTDPTQIPPVLGLAVGLVVLTTLTKLATGWYAAGRYGVSTRGRVRAGAALTPRGEFSIVIAGLGAAAGVEPLLGPLSAAYVLLLAVLAPVLMRSANAIGNLIEGWRERRARVA